MPASFFTDRSPTFGRDDKPTADEVGEILIAHSASCGLSGNGILIEPALAGDIRFDTPLRWKQNYAAPSGARTINLRAHPQLALWATDISPASLAD